MDDRDPLCRLAHNGRGVAKRPDRRALLARLCTGRNDKPYYFYPKPLDKLTLRPRNKLKYNADGSLDLSVSHLQPAGVV